MSVSADSNADAQAARYIVNGVVAAAVHFAVLKFSLDVLHVPYAGLANLIAATAGITTSFLGSRYFVFKAHDKSLLQQFAKFSLLYVCIAILHATVLWVWTDINGFDFRLGFLLATGLATILSFWGNKALVFR
jgi:putative flippase GtrA